MRKYFLLTILALISLSLLSAADQTPNPVFEPHKSLIIDIPNDKKGPKLGVIVTDEAEVLGSTFLFKNEPKKYPRILYAERPYPLGADLNEPISIPSLAVSEKEGTVSVHFVEIYELKGTKSGIVGFKNDFFNYFPQGKISTTIEEDDVENLGPLDKFRTVIYSILIENDENFDLECSYSLDYMGIVRGVYFNDMKRGNWWNGNNGNYTKVHQVIYADKGLLKRNQMTVITIIGHQLHVIDFKIDKCESKGRQILHPRISYWYVNEQITNSKKYDFKTDQPTVKCAANANRCLDAAHSISCKSPYVLNGFACEEFCPPPKLPGQSECVSDLNSDSVEMLLIEKTKNPHQFYTRAYLDFTPTDKTVFMVIPGPLETYRYSQISGGEYFLHPTFPKKFIKPDADNTWQTYFEMPNDQYCSFTMYYADLETDPAKALLLSDYHGKTPFQYNDISGRYLSLNESVELSHKEGHVISTYILCEKSCKVSIVADGFVKVLLDFKKVVDQEFDDVRVIPIESKFTVLTFLIIDLVAATKFEFLIEGEEYFVGTEKVVRGYEPYEMDGCECPLGSYKTATGCIDNSFLNVQIFEAGHSCNYLTVAAEMNPTEKMLYSEEDFEWKVEAQGPHGEVRASKINDYLKDKRTSVVTIPHDLLWKNTNYIFRTSYINTMKRTVESESNITLDEVSPSVPLTCFFHFRFWDILSFWPLVILNTIFIPILLKFYSFERKNLKITSPTSNLYLVAIFVSSSTFNNLRIFILYSRLSLWEISDILSSET
jgi:hypothetical protein